MIMPGDLDAAIREALEDPEHEDWCDLRDAAMAEDGRDCNCFLGPRTTALVAVLDVQMPDLEHEHPDDRKALADGWAVCRAAMVDAIATKLGVTERTDQ